MNIKGRIINMTYLLVATACSASIALIFKYSERLNTELYVVTSANYFIAFLTSLIMILYNDLFNVARAEVPFLSELRQAFVSENYILSPYGSVLWGISVGIIAGFFFFLSFIYYQKSVNANGVSLSGTFAKLGILVPMICSIILWKEMPTPIQFVGIAFTLAAIIIVNWNPSKDSSKNVNCILLLLFIFGGMAEFSNKIYQKYAINEYKDVFLFTVFFVAFLISVYYIFRNKCRVSIKDIIVGFAVGMPNLFSCYFLILALDNITASIAFPVYSAGSILLINIGGAVIFKEKISSKNRFAIAMIIVALILINI